MPFCEPLLLVHRDAVDPPGDGGGLAVDGALHGGRHHVGEAQQLGETPGGDVEFPGVFEIALLGAVLAFEQRHVDVDPLDVGGVRAAAVGEHGLFGIGDALARVDDSPAMRAVRRKRSSSAIDHRAGIRGGRQ